MRWNCKAGKCGSCSAEINGQPRLMCMTRLSIFAPGEAVTITPLRTFPVIKDLVTDVSFNYEKARQVPAFSPAPDQPVAPFTMYQPDVERSQEFRKCIECWLCQNTCHVVRDHEENKPHFAGPRFFIRYAELDMHPNDGLDRKRALQESAGPWLLQHHQVLHRGLPGAHQDHRQRHHPDEGARRRRQVRPARPVPRSPAGTQGLTYPRPDQAVWLRPRHPSQPPIGPVARPIAPLRFLAFRLPSSTQKTCYDLLSCLLTLWYSYVNTQVCTRRARRC